jgi:GT2 family glycosyltransferase
MKIEIISATRATEEEFWARAALGQSLRRLSREKRLVPRIVPSNARGLPRVYNEALATAAADSILVFLHDDVWLDDYHFADRLIDGLSHYDALGVAGNRRRVSGQPSWLLPDTKFKWDDTENLSGAVAHGSYPFGAISWYGSCPAECELLDGLLLAARKQLLDQRGLRFDPRFDFHFYDLDFCRSARQLGLRLGTWPISLTHQSRGGGIGTASWQSGYRTYLEKWGS